MIDLITQLKKLKSIEPDATYKGRSRELILGTPLASRKTVWDFIQHSVQSGSALALVGVFVLLLFGGFSTWRFLSPFELSALDAASLRAEAQAIDIQVQLTNVGYTEHEPALETNVTSPSSASKPSQRVTALKKLAENLGVSSSSTATSTAPLSLDHALELLSE